MSEEKPKHNPQKKVWKDVGRFDTYDEALASLDSAPIEAESKIKRCGPNGTKYKVKRVAKYLDQK